MQERGRHLLRDLGVPFSVAAGFFNRELPEDGEERLDGQEGIQVWMNSQNPFSGIYDLVTGAHVGPGTLAVFYEGKDRSIKRSLL